VEEAAGGEFSVDVVIARVAAQFGEGGVRMARAWALRAKFEALRK
jgi:vacuolar-type H+-ATPase catalytic subunit A/Vma1